MASSSFTLSMVGFDPPPTATRFTGGINCSDSVSKKGLTEGVGDDQLSAVICVGSTIAPSGSVTIDLILDDDRYGLPLTATDVVAAVVLNTNESGVGIGTLKFAPSVADGWTSFIKGGGHLELPPETGFAVWGFKAGKFPVGGTNKKVDYEEVSTTDPIDVRSQVWIRK